MEKKREKRKSFPIFESRGEKHDERTAGGGMFQDLNEHSFADGSISGLASAVRSGLVS